MFGGWLEHLASVDSHTKCNTLGFGWVAGDTGHFLIRQEGVATMAYHQLTQEQRYLINHNKRLGKSIRGIAAALDRAPSTIATPSPGDDVADEVRSSRKRFSKMLMRPSAND